MPAAFIFIAEQASSANINPWTPVIITQSVSLLIFALTVIFTARSARKAHKRERKSDRISRRLDVERENENRRLDMKRAMLMEAWPAAQLAYFCLVKVVNPAVPIEEVGRIFEAVRDPMAKLQACAGDETLDAAQKFMTANGVAFAKLMKLRLTSGEGPRPMADLMDAWTREIPGLLEPLANLLFAARVELGLTLDKDAFIKGVQASNDANLAQLHELLQMLRELDAK